MTERLVNTAAAARALNVHPATLRRWAEDGIVRPAAKTAGGHARWDLERLRVEVAAAAERHEQGLPQSEARPAASQSVVDSTDEPAAQRVTEQAEPAAQRVTELVGSGAAAEAVGATKSALTKWMREGLVTPAQRVGRRGDARWDLDELRRQMTAGGLQGRTPPARGLHSDRQPPHLTS
jgi:DNA-binding transcriptional MerR regulator